MFREILVPTDASEYSRRAFEVAVELAKTMGGEILLLHVTYDPAVYFGPELTKEVKCDESELITSAKLAFKVTTADTIRAETKIRYKTISGHPSSVIIEEADRQGIHLIVMGSNGHGPIRGAVLGSVAQRVLSHATCPVLLVR